MNNLKTSVLKLLNNITSELNNINITANSVVIFGQHACKSALENIDREKQLLLTTVNKYPLWSNFVRQIRLNIKIIIIKDKELDHIANKNVHQNIVVIAKPLKKVTLGDYLKKNKSDNQKIILLDQVSDPQNIGSIIRSAFAFGFDAIGLLKNHSPFETSSIIKASSGEIEKITLIELGNLVSEINLLKKKGFFAYGLAKEGNNNIKNFNLDDKKIALVVGSEGKGLRKLTIKNLDKIFYIPIHKNCNSINASNAAAIAMYQFGG